MLMIVGRSGSGEISVVGAIMCLCLWSEEALNTRVRGWTVAPVLRGWPPPRRECHASLLVTKLDSLQLGFWSLGDVLAILWEAVRLSLDLDGGLSGVRRF